MAWFQNLAGKAEDLLNKIDQNAATVLNEGNTTKIQDNYEDRVISISQGYQEDNQDQERTVSGALKLSRSQSSFGSLLETDIKSDKLDSPQHEKLIENARESVNGDVFDKVTKRESIFSKSSSLHDSFILFEDNPNFTEKINKLELENHDLNQQLLNLQHLCAELRNENATFQSQVETANYLVAAAQSEMEQYRARAQRILQEKEKLITYKQNPSMNTAESNILTNYNEELKKELEFQQTRNVELSDKVNRLTKENSNLQQQIVLTQKTSHQSIEMLEQSLVAEKKIRSITEEECRTKSHEFQLKLQELSQQYSAIKMKNEEINNLKEALKQRTNINLSDDFESRIKSLTDTLMTKQNALETVTTERNALRIQLEKLESEYHQNLTQLQRAQVRVINVNDTDDVKSQVPQFMRVSPLDAGVTRRVKHAYSTVDAISIRTGIFLRRYPIARVFVFCYIVLLHLWAFVILFIYAPTSR